MLRRYEVCIALGIYDAAERNAWVPGLPEAEFEALFAAVAVAATPQHAATVTTTTITEHYESEANYRRLVGAHSRNGADEVWLERVPLHAPCDASPAQCWFAALACAYVYPDALHLRPPPALARARALARRAHDPMASPAARAGVPLWIRRSETRSLQLHGGGGNSGAPPPWVVDFVRVHEHRRPDAGAGARLDARRCEVQLRQRHTAHALPARIEAPLDWLRDALGSGEAAREQLLLARLMQNFI